MPDQVPEPVKTERLHRLQDLLERQLAAFNGAMLGRRVDVLIDRPGRRAGQFAGRSPWLQPVHVDSADALMGRIVPVEIVEVHANSLKARPLSVAAPVLRGAAGARAGARLSA
jgi:tRNA-2-methylthio-N6-dimethylallyladenosine synthase